MQDFKLPTEIIFERKPPAAAIVGRGHAQFYRDIKEGLLPQPVHIGRTSVWARHELIAVNAARLAGQSDDQIKALVRKLEISRSQYAKGVNDAPL